MSPDKNVFHVIKLHLSSLLILCRHWILSDSWLWIFSYLARCTTSLQLLSVFCCIFKLHLSNQFLPPLRSSWLISKIQTRKKKRKTSGFATVRSVSFLIFRCYERLCNIFLLWFVGSFTMLRFRISLVFFFFCRFSV